MANPGSPGSSGGKGRAYLLLSLILLVWNTAASLRFALQSNDRYGPEPGAVSLSAVAPSGESVGPPGPVSAVSGPLTLRQRYLIGKRVDINKGNAVEIAELPGISRAVAEAVVAERQRRGGFRNPRELLSVPGIKERRLEKILPFLAEMENN